MTAASENHENPGIFVRHFDDKTSEVLWLDGKQVIEKAREEETISGEPITAYLKTRNVNDVVQAMYSPLGEFEGYANLRQITLHESVHYLARHAKICAFLRPKGQAAQFVQGLYKGKESDRHRLAAQIEQLIPNFGADTLTTVSKSALYRSMESQLLNLTTG